MIPSECPYCNNPMINEFFTFKRKDSLQKSCNFILNHGIKISSTDGNYFSKIIFTEYLNNNIKEYIWDFTRKHFYFNGELKSWNEPDLLKFKEHLERLSLLLIID